MEVQENNKPEDNKTSFSVVSIPIGNPADISIRALNTLSSSDLVICEEYKPAAALLRFWGLKKELLSLSEHNSEEFDLEYILKLHNDYKHISMISDCGVPTFCDPGNNVVNTLIAINHPINFVGGANSLLSLLSISKYDITRFQFIGFLSPKADIRKSQIVKLNSITEAIVLLETPYRLLQLIKDIVEVKLNRNIMVGFKLTMSNEAKFYGTPEDVLQQIEQHFTEDKPKGEFLVIVEKLH